MTPQSMTDILDIQGIIHSSLLKFVWSFLILLFILIIIFFLIALIRRVARRQALGDDHLSSHDKVFLEVERLRSQKFLERGDFRRYYFFLSEIFRRYLSDRFGYPALEQTSPEIISGLPAISFFPQLLGLTVTEILEELDQVKFAGKRTHPNAAFQVTEKILSFVRDTHSPLPRGEGIKGRVSE